MRKKGASAFTPGTLRATAGSVLEECDYASAQAVAAAGATPLRGALADLDTLRAAAEAADNDLELIEP